MKRLFVLSSLVIIFALAACGGVTYPVEYDNGTVVATEESNGTYVVSVEVKGFAGVPIEAQLTVSASGNVTAFEVTHHMETAGWGKDVIEGDYIASLLANQNNLDGVDAEAGSTATSDGLKNAIRVAKEHVASLQ